MRQSQTHCVCTGKKPNTLSTVLEQLSCYIQNVLCADFIHPNAFFLHVSYIICTRSAETWHPSSLLDLHFLHFILCSKMKLAENWNTLTKTDNISVPSDSYKDANRMLTEFNSELVVLTSYISSALHKPVSAGLCKYVLKLIFYWLIVSILLPKDCRKKHESWVCNCAENPGHWFIVAKVNTAEQWSTKTLNILYPYTAHTVIGNSFQCLRRLGGLLFLCRHWLTHPRKLFVKKEAHKVIQVKVTH